MNIKSLLLGSVAAFAAVSTSQAADAIIVEPEPMEYVRVCDAYGSGFFYIPGTETCIRFSGYVRSSYEVTNVNWGTALHRVVANTSTTLVVPNKAKHTFWGHRARLNLDTRNETDWGTLRALFRLEAGDSNTDADIDMDVAMISLAGFRAGFAGANYWTSNHGFAGVNLTGLGSAYTPATDDGWYGFDDAAIFDYTWSADGFSITLGIEDPRLSTSISNTTNTGGTENEVNYYAGFNWSDDWGSVAFTAIYDNLAMDTLLPPKERGGWAWKASLDINLSDMIPGGILHAMYMTDGDQRTDYVHNWNGLWNPKSIWQLALQADISDEVQFVAQYSHAEGSTNELSAYSPTSVAFTEGDAWNASVGLNWFPAAAPGFSLRGSYKFGEFNRALRVGKMADAGSVALHDEEYDGFFIGLRRDF